MCLAVPGKIIEARQSTGDLLDATVAKVDFQGTRTDVSLVFTPEAQAGDWVLVHAGYALHVLDEKAALETWAYLEQAEVVKVES
ncbi:MAG: HypC/HybG/HupF family hydrogenase formation chaperone [Planctomycetota bacterium]